MKIRVFTILLATIAIGFVVCLRIYAGNPAEPKGVRALSAPTLTVTTSGTTVTVSWTAIAGATGYTLSYASYPYTGPDSIVSLDMGTQTGISANLWEGASFYVAVQAYNSSESSVYSNIALFIIGGNIGTVTGTVTSRYGAKLQGVKVSIGTLNIETDGKGSYQLGNVPKGERVLVTFKKAGYVSTQKVTKVFAGKTTTLHAKLVTVSVEKTIPSNTGGTVSTYGAEVVIPSNAFEDEAGNPFSGEASVKATYFDPTKSDFTELFPGQFMGIPESGSQEVPIESFGFIDVGASSGTQDLKLREGKQATITLPLPEAIQSRAPETIPLWYYNENTGQWMEEGSATKVGNTYVGNVSHFSSWNADCLYQSATITGRVVDQDGNPLDQVRVTAIGQDYTGALVDYTRQGGRFSIEVKPNSTVEMLTIFYGTSITHRQVSTPGPGQTKDIGDLVLASIGFLSGSVVDQNGNPLFPARVFAIENASGTTSQADTNQDGTFAIVVPAKSRVDIHATFSSMYSVPREEPTPYPNETFQINDIVIIVPGDWQDQDSGAGAGTTENYTSVHFVDSYNGWVSGTFGVMLHTNTGGAFWNRQNPGTGNSLLSVHFADAQNGWAVGTWNTIIHTVNGGVTWQPQDSGLSSYNFHFSDVFFVDTNVGWIVGDTGTILRTTDGGVNWNPQNSGTTDGLEAVFFIDANRGWAVGSWFGVGGNGVILHTVNGGGSWNLQDSGVKESLNDVHFTDNQNGWIVGYGGTILHTVDGGGSWIPQDSGTTRSLTQVFFTSPQSGWIVGMAGGPYGRIRGTILYTSNGGGDWSDRTPGTLRSSLNGLHFPNAHYGWCVGRDNTILRITQ
jgi:photosystem II stability/assembly factor-like uncharacterized protein